VEASRNGPVVVEHLDDRSVARVVGEIDAANVGELETGLRSAVRAAGGPLVIDLSGLSYLDSAGIRALFVTAREAGKHQVELQVVIPPSSPLLRLLDVAGFTGSFPVFGSLEETAGRVD
jgi:anti-anti-sigma factor